MSTSLDHLKATGTVSTYPSACRHRVAPSPGIGAPGFVRTELGARDAFMAVRHGVEFLWTSFFTFAPIELLADW